MRLQSAHDAESDGDERRSDKPHAHLRERRTGFPRVRFAQREGAAMQPLLTQMINDQPLSKGANKRENTNPTDKPRKVGVKASALEKGRWECAAVRRRI